MNSKRKFNKIVSDIKKIRVQGARNVAKAALKAYFLIPSPKSKERLLASRPTEPMMEHVLSLVKNNDAIFTHCHSTNVNNALIYAKKRGKKFEVYTTETRPLYQGRITALALRKAGIKVTIFVDSAVGIALSKEQGTKKVSRVFLGADAITKKGVINKVGSETVAKLARQEKIPVYIVGDSWKFTDKKIPTEQRELDEVWDRAPKGIRIKNPSFEFVDKKYITRIITEK